ncbi:MAG: PHP domain-containing protein, partial [Bacteroidota bacterium]
MYLIFDTETTGLPRRHEAPASDTDNWPRMVQLAWQLHDERGALMEVYSALVRPEGFTIPYNAEQVHRISTQRALDEGLPLDDVLERFAEAVEGCRFIAGHNLLFDVRVVEAECIRRGRACGLPTKTLLDTKECSTQFCALPGGKGGRFKWPSLTELHKKLFGIGFDEAHDAAVDVEATARCFLELIRLGVIPAEQAGLDEAAYQDFLAAHPQVVQAIGLKSPAAPTENPEPKGTFALDPAPGEAQLSEAQLSEAQLIEAPLIEAPLAPSGTEKDSAPVSAFVHLHCHSHYSLLPGTSTVDDLARFAAEQGSPAIALTDHGNMYGAFAFSEACRKAGVKAILGLEAYLCRDHSDHRTRDHGFHQVLLARNEEGYHNLIRLSSAAFLD